MEDINNNLHIILKKYWKIDSLKDKQKELIFDYLKGNDVIGLLPTGYGKSLCYLLPPLITNKVIFIISPLISLMEDQKEKLIEMNIEVATLHGNNINKDREIFNIIDGKIKIVYMSPEYLVQGNGIELATTLFEKNNLGFLAIDESHCISAWGHDFRNVYLKINKFRKHFPNIPIMAVTATATSKVVDDIINNLNLRMPKIIIANFDRPNIYLKCTGVEDINIECINEFINKYEEHKIIIYTNTRESTIELSTEINEKYGNISSYYHAGMSKTFRNKIQNKFNNNNINIIVSTVAFGMGIDQTVRCVIIFGEPNSIEEYYQMIGRAGRDGDAAESIVLYREDKHKQNIAITLSTAKKNGLDKEIVDNKIRCLKTISSYFDYPGCRRRYILEYFNQVPKFFWCNYCDNCCEGKMVDMTNKFIDVIFNKKKYTDVFTDKELEMLGEENIKKDKKKEQKPHELIRTNNNIMELLLPMRNWKKIIEANKYLETKIPNKYLIKIKKF
jgi:ATP-dependent DNA helicase RecQ